MRLTACADSAYSTCKGDREAVEGGVRDSV
jgi:hypothetical protein